jgi:hypothetical protein
MRAGMRTSGRVLAAAIGLVVLAQSAVFGEEVALAIKDQEALKEQTTDQRIDQLQALIEAQRSRIESLRSQLEAAEQGSGDKVRVEEVRKIVRELLADGDFRESLYPEVTQVGYDKGFYIKSTEEDFLLRISGFMKVRYTGIERQNDNPRIQGRQPQDDVSGFQVNDLRLYFSGYIHSPKLTYMIIVEGPTRISHDWRTYRAEINYEVVEELQVLAGLMKVPFGRQWLVTKSELQFIDRSLANETFNSSDRSVGVQLHGTLARRLTYHMALTNGVQNPADSPVLNDQVAQLDTDFAYTARLVAHLLGGPIANESDLAYSKDPQMEVGMSFLYSDNNGDIGGPGLFYGIPERIRSGRGIGGFGPSNSIGADMAMFGADYAFRYRGLSVTAEYFLRSVDSDSDYSQWFLRTTRNDSDHQQGGYVQAGYYIIPKKVEAVARLGGVWDIGDDNTWEYTFGANYYPFGNYNFLVQADFTHIDEAPTTSSSGNWSQNDNINMFRVQMQVRF